MKSLKDTMVNKANRVIIENNLPYSPELFGAILEAMKSSPFHIEEEKQRQEMIRANHKPHIDEGKSGFLTGESAFGKYKLPR